jgi:hypothetical protein
MPDERVLQQVYGILSLNKVEFRTTQDDKSFLVPYGSAGVFIEFKDWGEGGTLLNLHAFVLEQVDSSGDRRLKILEELNDFNKHTYMGKAYLDEEGGYVVLEHDILGDNLDGPELMGVLGLLASTADQMDDDLIAKIGTGRRAKDAWDAASDDAKAPDGSGPTVAA